MAETTDPLVLDLVEWIGREPRLYSEVIEAWRTSCPRLPVWEEAVERGYLAHDSARDLRVVATPAGLGFLAAHKRG